MTDDKTSIAQLELLDLIINNSKGIIWAIDHDYCLLYANKAYQNALVAAGGKEMSIGQSVLSDEYPKEFLNFWKANYDKCFNDEHFSIESEMPWADGIHYIENSLNPIKNTNGILIGLVVTSLDISDRKRAEKALKISEEKWRTLFEILPVGVSIRDKDNNILESNPELNRILDLTKSDLENRKYQQRKYLNSDNQQIQADEFPSNRAINEQKIIRNFEIGIVKENGTTIWTKVNTAPFINHTKCVIVTTDITKSKQVEQALKEKEENLTEAQIVGNVGHWEYNIVNQKLFWSDHLYIINGMSNNDFQPNLQNSLELCHVDDREKIKNALINSIQHKTNFDVEYRIVTKSGKTKYLYAKTLIKFDENKNPLRIIGTVADITDRKQAELIIQQQNNVLKKINTDKDRFITILGHDLKSPFNSILGFLSLLTQNVRKYDIDKIESQINIVNNSAQNTFKLLEDILMWVRANSGKIPYEPQKLNFATICNEVIENLKLTANTKNITINHFATDEINIFADINMLNTVLRNLVSNSIKFTNKSGRIDIYAEKNHSNIIITVSDNGVGIEPDTLKKLFEISQKATTDGTENEKGTGLGLLLCKEFVEKHGGEIWVESDFGKGSDFKFTMPLCND